MSESEGATAKATAAAEEAGKKAEAVSGRFDEIDQRFDTALVELESEIAGASGSVRAAADKSIADLQNQLKNIQDQIIAVNTGAELQVAGLKEEQINLRTEAEKARRSFAANSEFSIFLYPLDEEYIQDADILSRNLISSAGFQASVSTFFTDKEGLLMPTSDPGGPPGRYALIVTYPDAVTDTTIKAIEVIFEESLFPPFDDEVKFQVSVVETQFPGIRRVGSRASEISHLIIHSRKVFIILYHKD